MKAPLVRLYARYFLVFVSIILWSTANATLYSHNGGIDPLTEGWTFLDTNPGVSVGPVSDNGTNAWSINDSSSASGSRTRYNITPLPQEAADAMQNGWILRANLRVVNTNDALDNSILIEYNDGNRRFLVRFGSDSVGDPLVQLEDSVSTTVHVVTGGANQYNLYELVYDPQTQRASLFVNSQPTNITNQPGTDGTSVARRINWGSGGSVDTGHAQYNLVEWQIARDSDADFIIDYLDNCPFLRNFEQIDTAGVGANSSPDGVGDQCQCGDLTLDGVVDNADLLRYRQALADPENNGFTLNERFLCDVYGEAIGCDVLSATIIERAINGNAPDIIQSCSATNGDIGSFCGDFLCDSEETCAFDGCQDDCGKCNLGTSCSRDEDCASNICNSGVCSAPATTNPNVPIFCGDSLCAGSESCSHVGKFGCFDDCGPCEANANPNDQIQPDYCLEHRDCNGDQLCVNAGVCINTNTGDSIGILCAEDAGCPQGDFRCNLGAFTGSVFAGRGYDGICSDLQTPCSPTFNILRPNELQQAECTSGDLCYRRKICTEPGLNTPNCGSPIRGFAERCNNEQSCGIDDDCKSDTCYTSIASSFVRSAFCIPANSLDEGYPCNDDNECRTNSCFLGFCSQADGICLSDGDCASNERCVGFPGGCVPTLCGNGTCSELESCHVPPMSPPSFITQCQEDCGLCETGHSCGDNSDCISGDCDLFFGCQSRCGDGVCDSVEDCTTSLTSPLNNLCRADCGACANGDRCNTDADCVNDCISGRCAPTPPTCNDIGDCPNGGECTSDNQCASNRCIDTNGILSGGRMFCVPSNCTSPSGLCTSSSQCCDFPTVDLTCQGRVIGITPGVCSN